MAKSKAPDLADFAIHLAAGGHRKIRASSLAAAEGWLYLQDAGGGVLFCAPREAVKYVKRLEPGEEVPEDKPAPSVAPVAADGPLFAAIIEPIGVDPAPPAEVADPGPIETGPRKRGAGGRFTRA
jgi:hypothetical protein